MEDDLVAWGRVVRIETRGRVSGRTAVAVIADPACRVTLGESSFGAVARQLEREEHQEAVRDLILRYGTPAESLGAGPSFELRRTA
jgi:hypothetical protein